MESMRSLAALLLPAALVLLALPAAAVQFPDKPPKTDFFVDRAGLINEADRAAINQTCGALLSEETVPIFVVTIDSLASMDASGYTIEKYAYELFNDWGVGLVDRNYGMLLVVSRGDRKARIELGGGWGHSYNIDAGKIMNDLIIPEFKEDAYSKGIRRGVEGMDALARGLALPKPERPWWAIPVMLGLIALVIGIAYSLFKSGRTGWGWAFLAAVGVLLFFLLKAAASGGGSGGGFGGGSSGGGGATGSW